MIILMYDKFCHQLLPLSLDTTSSPPCDPTCAHCHSPPCCWPLLESQAELCMEHLKGFCPRGFYCPWRHSRQDATIVCKHWLRHLCKKGDDCEFLHLYDMMRMPECHYYQKYGEWRLCLYATHGKVHHSMEFFPECIHVTVHYMCVLHRCDFSTYHNMYSL